MPAGAGLQWGRDLVVADTPPATVTFDQNLCLQWGRDLVVADTGVSSGGMQSHGGPSMGPRPSSRGYSDLLLQEANPRVPSMGPRPSSRGYDPGGPHPARRGRPSMGPRPSSRGYSISFLLEDDDEGDLQWGRDLVVADTFLPGIDSVPEHPFNGAAT